MQHWGGLIETIYENYEQKDIEEKITILGQKLQKLDHTKTIDEIKYLLHFTKEEIDYLNSPLLDEIYETIFSEDVLLTTIIKDKVLAFTFYYKRCEKSTEKDAIIEKCETYLSLKILKLLLENNEVKDIKARILNLLQFRSPKENIILLFLEYASEIPKSVFDNLNTIKSAKILEKIVEKTPKDLAQLVLERAVEIADISVVKKILEKFSDIYVAGIILKKCYCNYVNPDITNLLLEYSPKQDFSVVCKVLQCYIESNQVTFEYVDSLVKNYNIYLDFNKVHVCLKCTNPIKIGKILENYCDFELTLELFQFALKMQRYDNLELIKQRLRDLYNSR